MLHSMITLSTNFTFEISPHYEVVPFRDACKLFTELSEQLSMDEKCSWHLHDFYKRLNGNDMSGKL